MKDSNETLKVLAHLASSLKKDSIMLMKPVSKALESQESAIVHRPQSFAADEMSRPRPRCLHKI